MRPGRTQDVDAGEAPCVDLLDAGEARDPDVDPVAGGEDAVVAVPAVEGIEAVGRG